LNYIIVLFNIYMNEFIDKDVPKMAEELEATEKLKEEAIRKS
jgi:hypothetical protein